MVLPIFKIIGNLPISDGIKPNITRIIGNNRLINNKKLAKMLEKSKKMLFLLKNLINLSFETYDLKKFYNKILLTNLFVLSLNLFN